MLIVIRDVRIVGVSGEPPIERGYVVVDGDRITVVAAGDPGPVSHAHEAIDGGGRTLLPGLIDSHVHLVGAHLAERLSEPGPFRAAHDALRLADVAAQLVSDGITGLRDLGYPHHGIFAVREAIERGAVPGPRLALAGRAIAASGGHGTGIAVEVDGADGMRRAVRVEAKAGADWIKLMVTGGTATPGEEVSDVQLTLEEACAAVDEAHRRGRQVTAHVSNLAGTRLALDAGVDCIEHGIELDTATVRRMADSGVRLAATLRCSEVEGTAESGGLVDDFIRDKAAGIYRRQQESFQLALGAGVRIVAATDAGPAYFRLGIASLAQELETMVRLGMSPLDAVSAATSEASDLLGWADVGTIAPGQLADVVVVDGDPGVDITAIARPWLVLARGRLARDPRAGDQPAE